MKKFKDYKILKEDELMEQVDNEQAIELMGMLRDERFGNEGQRKRFVDIISSLMNLPAKDIGPFFRKLGDACSVIGDEMLNLDSDIEIEDNEYSDENIDISNNKISSVPNYNEGKKEKKDDEDKIEKLEDEVNLSDEKSDIDSEAVTKTAEKGDVEEVIEEDIEFPEVYKYRSRYDDFKDKVHGGK